MDMTGQTLLKAYFPNNRDKNLEEVIQSMNQNDPYHLQVMSIIQILSKTPKQRLLEDLEEVESFFKRTYKYMGVLKENLSEENYSQIFREIKFECLPICKAVFEAGDIGRKMYFILHGEVGILLPLQKKELQAKVEQAKSIPQIPQKTKLLNANNFDFQVQNKYCLFRMVNILHQGDFFGEVAIQNRILRTGTVLTRTHVLLAVLTFDTYQKCIELTQNQITRDIIAFLLQVSIFKTWTIGGLHIILKNCEEIQYKPFEYIFKRKDKIKYIYFIRKGEVKLTIYEKSFDKYLDLRKQKPVSQINAVVQLTIQQHFGDWELYLNENEDIINLKLNLQQNIEKIDRLSSVIAMSHVTVIRMTLSQFVENYKIFGYFNIVKEICLQQSQVRNDINEKRIKIMKTIDINESLQNPEQYSPPCKNSDFIIKSLGDESLKPKIQITSELNCDVSERINSQRIITQTKLSQEKRDFKLDNVRQDFSKSRLKSDRSSIDVSMEQYHSFNPNNKLKIFDTFSLKRLSGQQKVLYMMGQRSDPDNQTPQIKTERQSILHKRSDSQTSRLQKLDRSQKFIPLSTETQNSTEFWSEYYKSTIQKKQLILIKGQSRKGVNTQQYLSTSQIVIKKSQATSTYKFLQESIQTTDHRPQNLSFISGTKSKLFNFWQRNLTNNTKLQSDTLVRPV